MHFKNQTIEDVNNFIFSKEQTVTLFVLEKKLKDILHDFPQTKDFLVWLSLGKQILPKSVFQEQL